MNLRKQRWSRVYESNEEELTQFLEDRGITATRHDVEAFDSSKGSTEDLVTILWCAEGSFTVSTENQGNVSMQPGDYLIVPERSSYEVQSGMTGHVVYVSGPTSQL